MKRFFKLGLVLHATFVVLLATGAYLGVVPTVLHALPHLDLVGHMLFIGALAFFLDGALDHRPLAGWSLGGAAVIAVAGVEEWAQRFSSRRSSTWSDFFADVIGVLIGVWLARRLTRGARRAAVEAA